MVNASADRKRASIAHWNAPVAVASRTHGLCMGSVVHDGRDVAGDRRLLVVGQLFGGLGNPEGVDACDTGLRLRVVDSRNINGHQSSHGPENGPPVQVQYVAGGRDNHGAHSEVEPASRGEPPHARAQTLGSAEQPPYPGSKRGARAPSGKSGRDTEKGGLHTLQPDLHAVLARL